MRIEVTIAKTSPLPAGAIDALAGYRQQLVRHWRIKRGQRTH